MGGVKTSSSTDVRSEVLPSLYKSTPSLQALAVLVGNQASSLVFADEQSRTLPRVGIDELQTIVADAFEVFRMSLPDPQNILALIDPSGTCLWTSIETECRHPSDPEIEVEVLASSLGRALGDNPHGDEMDLS